MNKILVALLVSSLIVSPAYAHESRHHRRNHNTSGVVAGVLGGILLGTIVEQNRTRRQTPEWDPYYEDSRPFPTRPQYYEHYCVTEQMVDKYGRVYYVRTCQ